MDYIENGPSDFEDKIRKAVEGIFLQCSSGRISYTPENPDLGGIPGTAKLLTQSGEKDYKIDSWKDGLKYLTRLEAEAPIPFIQNKLNAFKTKGTGVGISKINPVASISYKNMLSVPSTVFPSEGLDQNSLAAPGRIEQFKNGKFFFQYYFEVVDWEPGDENYIENLVNRDINLKGILSAGNMQELISQMCGIAQLFPANTPPSAEALLGLEDDGTINSDNIKIHFQDLFKEINFGIRYCYGAVSTPALDEDNSPIIKDQVQAVKNMFDSMKEILDLDDTKLSNENFFKLQFMSGPTQDADTNEYIDFVKETKSLMLVENMPDATKPSTTSSGNNTSFIQPYYSIVLPLFDEKTKINGQDAFEGGYALFDDRTDDVNFVSDQLTIFSTIPYGKKVMQDLVLKIPVNPAYEALLSYTFPIPKICNMMMLHNIIHATKSEDLSKSFNSTKNTIRALISRTASIKGKEHYKNDFSNPY